MALLAVWRNGWLFCNWLLDCLFSEDYKNAYDEWVVDKAFSSHEKACQYIIEKEFRRNDYYKKFSDDELMREAAAFVTEEEVL